MIPQVLDNVDREALVKQVYEEIGRYGVQCSETKELAPPRSLLAAIAALSAQGGEQTAVAWLICRADGSRDVVLSPLTDDTPMDYGDEAWPLVHQSSMPDSTDGQTADTVSVPREPTEAMRNAVAFLLLPSYEGQVDHQMGYDILSIEDINAIWTAMLAAAKEGK